MDTSIQNHTYRVKGMHCASCANIIERKLRKIPDIKNVSVSYATETANIEGGNVSLDAINQTIEKMGYSLEPERNIDSQIASDHTSHGDSSDKDLSRLRKNARISSILAFLSAVIMLWEALGEYALLAPINPVLKEFFHHLLPIIATYMLFAVGTPYLAGVWRFIRYGQANMDTLIGIGTSVAFLYSFIISAFEDSLRTILDVEILYYDVTIIVIGFVTIGKYLEARAKARTNDALHSLVALQTKTAIIQKDDEQQEVSIESIAPGDIVVIKPGAKVPVDAVVTQGSSYVDESMITGEPIPVSKNPGDKIVGGTINQDGILFGCATAIGKDSLLSHIIDLVRSAQNSRAPIQKMADSISSIFVPTVIVIAVVTFIVWITVGPQYLPFKEALALGITGFVGVLVIACPCALGLATPTAIIVGVGKGAKNGILIKNAEALEKFSRIRDIIFDKTGTLTQGKPQVIYFHNTGIYPDQKILSLALTLEKNSEHPLARAIATYAKEKGIEKKDVPKNSTHFLSHKGKGVSMHIDGEAYGIGSDRFIEEFAQVKIDDALLQDIKHTSHTPVILAKMGDILGYFFIGDALKESAHISIKQLKSLGITAHIATGDREETTRDIAHTLEIDSYRSRLLPEEKQEFVRSIRKEKGLIAVAGDGVNDAPALAAADVSVAMSTGTDVAIESSDITLLRGDIHKIIQAVRLSKQTLATIKQNLFWAFIFNTLGIPLATGIFYSIGITLNPALAGAAMAFSSVFVVSNSLRLKFTRL